MFVTYEDFNVRPYKIPNLDNELTLAEFNSFVEDWEEEWLPKIFGRSFYNAFTAGLAALPAEWDFTEEYEVGDEVIYGLNHYGALLDSANVAPESETSLTWELLEEGNRWLKIVKGYQYTPEVGTEQKWVGLMDAEKFAIFSSWLKAGVNNVSGVAGSVTANVENSEITTSAHDITRSWNKFARLIGGRTVYDKYDTLYGYLLSFSTASTFDDTFDESFQDFGNYLKSEFGYPGRLNPFNF